jgi:glycosyltransferase involved in cell wall biosynthesis
VRVCHVTTGHGLLDDRIFHKEAVSLARRGFEVTILGPSDRREERKMGVLLKGVKTSRARSRVARKLVLLLRICSVSLRLRCRVYHCHEVDAAIAVLPAVLLGAKLLYDVHEHFPENNEGRLSRAVLSLLGLADRLVSRMADLVITVDETLAKKYRASRDVAVIHNYPILGSYLSRLAGREGDLLIYAGGLTEERGVLEMIDALRLARERLPRIRLKMVGKFIPEELKASVKERIRELSLEDAIEIVDWVPFEKMPEVLACADAGLSFLRPIRRYSLAVPIKVYEYMAAGMPVIASRFQAVARIIEPANCGVLAEAGRADSLSRAIVSVLEDGAIQLGEGITNPCGGLWTGRTHFLTN